MLGCVTSDINYLAEIDQQLQSSPDLLDHELPLICANGEKKITVWSSLTRNNDSKKSLEIIGFGYDISKRKEIEERLQQSQKMDAIGQLAGGVAHDFNNMLAGILGAAQLLEMGKDHLNQNEIQLINMITQAVDRASDLTSKLLTFSRKGSTKHTTINLTRVIQDSVSILKRTIDKRIAIITDITDQNCTIKGDYSALQNALMNLGINGSHAMPDGGKLSISLKQILLDQKRCDETIFELTPGDYLEITVQDSGTGISPKHLSKIFEPFFTTKKEGEGTGLGLAAVYGTVLDHKGAIFVESVLEKGTTFRIQIPCSQNIAEQKNESQKVIRGSGVILLVDDEEMIRNIGVHLLEKMGYDVMTASTGSEAITIFQKSPQKIDCVVIDMMMPEMNGRETFFQLTKIDPRCKMILASGFIKEEILQELKAAGLQGYIRKPFRDHKLSKLLHDILSEKRK